MHTRISNVKKLLTAESLDGLLIAEHANVNYLTGYNGFSEIEREAFLLVTQGRTYLFTDPRYSEAVRRDIPHVQLVETTGKTPFLKNLEAIIKNTSLSLIGFEASNITVSEYLKFVKLPVTWKDVPLTKLRISKTSDEIASIKKACDIADTALMDIFSEIKVGMSEKEVSKILEAAIRELDAKTSFPTIVAFGANAAIPHHMTSEKILKQNDLILIDFGVAWESYCSDMTRTFFIGKATAEQEKLYSTVADAQQKAIEFLLRELKNNLQVEAKAVDQVAREYIISQGYPTIPHSLGHGIGLLVHEAPSLSPTSADILTEGMVFSIEPGIYLPGNAGVRIEDLFAIERSELIHLTNSPKKLTVI